MHATLTLRYVDTFTDRHGHKRHYFRRAGQKRVPLPGEVGSVEFMSAYQAALAANSEPQNSRATVRPGTIDALAALYYHSSEFHQLAEPTRRTYRNLIEAFRKVHGSKSADTIQTQHVRHLIAAKAETPAAANALLKMLRILMALAAAEGWRRDDPTQGVKKIRSRSEGFLTWSEEDIAAFEARWPIGTRENLALALMLYTGQRGRSDVTRMGRQHIQGGRIAVCQQKTGRRLLLPIHPRLQAAIDACCSGHLTFLATPQGRPYVGASFGNWFHDAVASAGLVGLTAHGLRKAAARRLAEAGATPHEIKSVTGHTTLREVMRYTEAVEQSAQADKAIARIK